MNYEKAVNIYVGREVNFLENEVVIDVDRGVATLAEWNLTDKPEPTIAELEAIWNNNKDAIELEEAKAAKRAEIANNTIAFYAAGFEHPTDDQVKFGLNDTWAINWNAIRADFLDDGNPADSFPYEVGTLDGEDYFISNYQEFKDIYKAGKARRKYLIKNERKLFKDIKNADTLQEVAAIVDNRT